LNLQIYQQLLSLIMFIVTGIIIGVLFDIFRIIRKSFKTNDIITCIEDALFWILSGFLLLFVIFKFNNGEIRLYSFVGLFIGFFIYLLIASKYVISISVNILNYFKNILYFPIVKTLNFTRKFIFVPICKLIVNIRRNDKINKKTN